uniref:Vitellogenin domain-containing protein n=1 Tax=Glossina palpalis gambiensis TaxID=67801 RepID=A0A1B0AUP2_9MUSC
MPSTIFNRLFFISLIVFLISCCSLVAVHSQLIPFARQEIFALTNKVTVKELNSLSSQETSYTFNSLLKVSSIWNSKKNQLLQVHFMDNRVKAPRKKTNKEFSQPITKMPDRPFYISLKNGKPVNVIAHTYRDQSLLNMEKAVASLLQIQHESGLTTEVDVLGECKTFYSVRSKTRIEKLKTDCSHWDLKVNYRAEKPLGVRLSSQEMVEYDLSEEGMLIKAQSVETHRMSLEAQPEVGSKVESLFVLEHTGSDEKSVKQLVFKSLDEAIESLLEWYRVFEINGDVDGVISESKDQTLTQQVSSYVKDLYDDQTGKESMAKAFVNLLPLARITKQSEFKDILNEYPDIQFQLVDLLAAVQTEDAHNAVYELLESDDELLEQYLKSLAVGTHPDTAIIEDLLERLQSLAKPIENDKLSDSVLQTLASLTKQLGFEPGNAILMKIRSFILNNLESECVDDEACKTRYIRALQNLQDPSTVDTLLNLALDGETKISVTAMQALRSFPIAYFNEKHLQKFSRIFYQTQKKYDTSARTLALEIILTMKPSKEQLDQLLDYLNSNDKHFEIKTYVIQKLNVLAEKCSKFRALLKRCLKERPHINNYNIMAQKGLTTVLSRHLSWTPAFNESLLSVQEIYRGVLKRGSVELFLSAGQEETSLCKLDIYTSGLTSFVGDSDSGADDNDYEASPVTAGMEISIQSVLHRPLVFFNGQAELMGHVWKGTASEPTPALQATTLTQDFEHYIILASGATAYMRVIGFRSIDLYGKVELSLWNRNAQTEIMQNTAAAVHGIMKVGFTYAQVSNEFMFSYEPRISLLADLDFYSGIKLCIQLQRPQMFLNHANTRSVNIKNTAKRYSKKVNSKHSHKFPGSTLALNQKNNEMCNIISQ